MAKRVQGGATPKARRELEAEHGVVWDTQELAKEFVILSIIDTSLVVRRKADGVAGWLEFQNSPRYYYRFRPVADAT